MSLAQGARIGPYEVVGLLGAGGMGEVYRARDSRLQRAVAIKVIATDLADGHLIRRFESEALAASALNHPNILTVYQFGEQDGLHYLATELVDGETLRTRLLGGALPLSEALDIGIQIASALEAAHAVGLIHRDIKPENVMLRRDGLLKVLDFGLAKVSTSSRNPAEDSTVVAMTRPGTVLGTMGYMPPEQVRGLEVDQRADIWSIGVVLHEMITGRAPFTAPTSGDIIASVLEREPPPLESSGARVPPELSRIVSKTLAKPREERYQTVRDLLIDLRRLKQQLEKDPVSVRTSQPAAPAAPVPSKAHRLSPAALIAAAALVLAVGAGLAWRTMSRTPAPPGAPAAPVLPTHTIEYWLAVQKIHDGKPEGAEFTSSGREIFEPGWKFRFNMLSAERGHLYVLNDGPGASGGNTLHLLYPSPAVAQGSTVDAGTAVETGSFVMDANTGTERFWILWSTQPLPAVEGAQRWMNAEDKGEIKDQPTAAAIRQLFITHSQSVTASLDENTNHSLARGSGDALAIRVTLQHH